MSPRIEATFQRLPGDVLKIFFRACEAIHCDEPLLELGEFSVSDLCHALGNECRQAEASSGIDASKLSEARSRFVFVNGWQSWSFAGELAGGERPRRACVRRSLNLFVDHPAEVALRKKARRFGHRQDFISHFMLGLRAGELRLMLVSDGGMTDGPGVVRSIPRQDVPEISGAALTEAVAHSTEPGAMDGSPQQSPPGYRQTLPTVAEAGATDGGSAPPVADILNTYLPPLSFLLRDNMVRFFAYAGGASFARGDVIARVVVFAADSYFTLKDKLGAFWGTEWRFDDLRWLASAPTKPSVPVDSVSLMVNTDDSAGEQTSGPGTSILRPPRTDQSSRAAPPRSGNSFTGVIGGYASWYNHYTAIDERIIDDDLGAIDTNNNIVNTYFLARGRPALFQIDDGWEKSVGDWRADSQKFPGGMTHIASRIAAKGLVPGIWLAPFLLMPDSETATAHPDWILRGAGGEPLKAGWNPNWGGDVWALDLSRGDVEDYLAGLFNTIVNDWGYRYLKLDFLYAGLLSGEFSGRKGGAWQHYTRVMKRILEFSRALDGSRVAFLSCGAPLESTAPFMPLMRSGADTREHWEWPMARLIGHGGRPAAKTNLQDSLGRAILDKTLLLCDPDVVFCRTEHTSLQDTEKFLIGIVAAMFGSQIMSSDDPVHFGKGAPLSDRLSEEDFTRQLLEWYKKLDGVELGVERSHLRVRDVYHFFSRDRKIYGSINLSDREGMFMLSQAPDNDTERSSSAAAPLPRHSILIFGV